MSTLYVVAVPIGNYDDITLRAKSVLESVDLIACEDTRKTGRLLAHLNIKKKLLSYYSYNEERRIDDLLGALGDGKSIALVTDGGTPAVSDPGALLINAAHQAGYDVSPIPGVSAMTAALSVCGMQANSAHFHGFLKTKAGRRKNQLQKLKEQTGLLIFYESPHRILKLLADLAEIFPGSEIFVAREMTKTHQSFYLAKTDDILEQYADLITKGEFTVIVKNDGVNLEVEAEEDAEV